MRILIFTLLIVVVSIAVLSSGGNTRPVHADVTTITFSEFPLFTSINAQYSAQGVIFTGSGNGPFIASDAANPTSPVLSGDPIFQGSIQANFVTPGDPARAATARNVSFDAGFFDQIGGTTVSWFDINGNLLGSQSNTKIGIERFTIPDDLGIFRIAITSEEAAGYAIDNVTFEIVAKKVDITEADIRNDRIRVVLSPINESGRFVLTLVGDTNVTLFDGTLSGSGTPYEFMFNPKKLPNGQFTEVRAVWTVNGVANEDSQTVGFRVLGNYRHSQYNTPQESTCPGPTGNAFLTTAACAFTPIDLRIRFISQVNLNGSGRSINFGDVKREFFCVKQKSAPAGSNQRSFRQEAIAPTCAGTTLDNTTVARRPGHPHLECGDQVLIVGLGNGTGTVKTVTDLCPGCPNNQLDNYTTDPACTKITDLGPFVTIRLR